MEKRMVPGLYDRELGFWDIFGGGWRVLRANLKPLFLFCFTGYVVLMLASWLLSVLFAQTSCSSLFGYRAIRFVCGLPLFLFEYIPSLGAIIITVGAVKNESVSVSRGFREVRGLFWSGFVISLYSLVLSAGMLTLFVLSSEEMVGIIAPAASVFIGILYLAIMMYLLFVNQALAIHGRKGWSAFVYSWKTVRGRWRPIFGKMLLLMVLLAAPFAFAAFALRAPAFEMLFALLKLSCRVFFVIFSTILFLNIDWDGQEGQVDKPASPDDPVLNSSFV